MFKANYRTVQFTLPWDDMPLDISFAFGDEKPAGKHGFLKQHSGNHFEFEDGTPARFWGVNFNSQACFPSHSYSEIVARRLAKIGINIVRFHQMDGDWFAPNLFMFNKAEYIENTRSLNPKSLDLLDYLIFCLKENGIYIYMDNLTYRRFRTGDGVEAPQYLLDGARRVATYNERMIELQKEFCSQLWNHYNPYTKLCYKDEPAIAMSEIINESDTFLAPGNQAVKGPYLKELQEKYIAWRREKGLPELEGEVDVFTNANRDIVQFKMEAQKAYIEDMYRTLRQLGVQCPLTGTNWSDGGTAMDLTEITMDYRDTHSYANIPGGNWGCYQRAFGNTSRLKELASFCDQDTGKHIWNRPLFLSEWDNRWPNEYRGESTLQLAAVCCLQGWDGATLHTYAYSPQTNVTMIAPPMTSNAVAGVPYRSGAFNCFNDPVRFGLFYHACLMIRRGDLQESQGMNFVRIAGPMISDMMHQKVAEDNYCKQVQLPCIKSLAETTRTYFAYPGETLPDNANILDPAVPVVDDNVKQLVSDTGEYRRDIETGVFVIDSPRTKAVGGFLAEAGTLHLKGLSIRCRNQYAVVALSSLNDSPLTESCNILLTAVGNADNTDAQYNENHTIQYSSGHSPVEAEVIVAELELSLPEGVYRVDAINPQGMQIGSCPSVYENGKLAFSIGGDFASVYYLIQKM